MPLVVGEDSDAGADLATELLSLPSPDHRFILCVDSYQVVIPGSESVEVGGEPDSRCSLIDMRDTTEVVLQFCGTSCGNHWGCWLSPTSFAVGGWNNADDFGQWKQGGLSLYSLRDSSVTEYQTRIVSEESYRAYEAAWHGWLLKRYQVWMRSRRAT